MELIFLCSCELIPIIHVDANLIALLIGGGPAIIEPIERFLGRQLTLPKMNGLVSSGEDSLARDSAREHLFLSQVKDDCTVIVNFVSEHG